MVSAAIEQGVPLPAWPKAARSPVARQLRPLLAGQSTTVELKGGLSLARVSRIAYSLWGKGGYRTAYVDDSQATVRVWRIA